MFQAQSIHEVFIKVVHSGKDAGVRRRYMKKILWLLLSIAFLVCAGSYGEEEWEAEQTESESSSGRLTLYSVKTVGRHPSGSVDFYRHIKTGEARADFFISNPTRRPVDFENAKYYVFDYKNFRSDLRFGRIKFRPNSILEPDGTMKVRCYCQIDPEVIKDAYIELNNGDKIHFVRYDDLSSY